MIKLLIGLKNDKIENRLNKITRIVNRRASIQISEHSSDKSEGQKQKIVKSKNKKPTPQKQQKPHSVPAEFPAKKRNEVRNNNKYEILPPQQPNRSPPETGAKVQKEKTKENEYCTDDDDALQWQLDPANGDTRSIFQPVGGDTVKGFIRKTMQETAFNDYQNKFSSIKQYPEGMTSYACTRNPSKNQYNDITCLDENRVRLCYPSNHPENSSNYIHANYVDSYKQCRAYICCQGPKENTIEDFWQMVWQEEVRVIVMLTKLYEENKCKCAPYWPEEKDGVLTYGQYTIKTLFVENKSNFTQTHLNIICSNNNESRTIAHLLFTAWPDRNIPQSPIPFLQFLAHARKYQHATTLRLKSRLNPLGPPMIVHCSAGVGRTGTFCAVDIFIRKMFDIRKIDLMGTVQLLRSQRAHSIQKGEQFQFVLICIVSIAINRLVNDPEEDMRGEPMEKFQKSLMQNDPYE